MSIVLDGDNLTTVGVINSKTAQNSTSGTSIDFTSIPAGVKRITVMLNNVSLSASANLRFQLGAGSVTTTGYATSGSYNGPSNGGVTSTSGFDLIGWGSAGLALSGTVVFVAFGSNLWVGSGTFGGTGQAYTAMVGGTVTLSGTLDRVRITTTNGTDTFDAGSINILYE